MPDVDTTEWLDGRTNSRKRQRMPKGLVELLETKIETLQDSVGQLSRELESLSVQTTSSLPASEESEENSQDPSPVGDPSRDTSLGPTSLATPSSQQMTGPPDTREDNTVPIDQSSAAERLHVEEYPLSAESIVSLSKVGNRGKASLFDSVTILHAILAMDGSDPYRPCILRSMSAAYTSQDIAVTPMLREMLLAEGAVHLDFYEKRFHSRFPFLEMSKMRDILQQCQAEGTTGGLERAHRIDQFCLYAVLAVTVAMDVTRISLARHIEGNLVLMALSHVDSVFNQGGGLEQVRALLLLAVYSLYRSSIGNTWHLIGFAIRICVSQSYHITHPGRSSGVSEAFWSAYMLEQEICIALDRPPSLGYQDLLAELSHYQPASNQEQASCEPWEYWILRSRLLAKLNAKPKSSYSAIRLMRALHSLRARYPRASPLHQPTTFTANSNYSVADEAYIKDLLCLVLDERMSLSPGLHKFVLFISILVTRRLKERLSSSTQRPAFLASWTSGILMFRAGLACIRSKCSLSNLDSELDRSYAITTDALRICSEYLSQVRNEFQVLDSCKTFFDDVAALARQQLLRGGPDDLIASHHEDDHTWTRLHGCVEALPTPRDQWLASSTIEAMRGRAGSEPDCVGRVADPGIYHGLAQLVDGLANDTEESRLYISIFEG